MSKQVTSVLSAFCMRPYRPRDNFRGTQVQELRKQRMRHTPTQTQEVRSVRHTTYYALPCYHSLIRIPMLFCCVFLLSHLVFDFQPELPLQTFLEFCESQCSVTVRIELFEPRQHFFPGIARACVDVAGTRGGGVSPEVSSLEQGRARSAGGGGVK